MDLLKKLFILILFLFPLGEIFRLDFGSGIVVKPLDIGLSILFITWIVYIILKKQEIKQKHIFIPVLLFSASGFSSLIISNLHLSIKEFLVSFSYLIRWIVYSGIYFVVGNFDKEFKRKIFKLLIILGALIVGMGYVQYFFYPRLRNLFYLGWDEHMYRIFSVFLDPNFAGTFFVLFFLFLVSMFLKEKSFLIGMLSVLTLAAIFLTFSRSALIMLLVSSSILFMLTNKKKLIAVLLGITFLVLTTSSRYFNIENVNLFRIVSSEARLDTAKKALEIIQKYPVFGVGFNAYRYAKLDYSSRNDNSKLISHADAGVDNGFLFVLATTGIVGFILHLFLWFRIFKTASILAIASIAGVFIDSMFINSLFYPLIMLWVWIIIAVTENR